MSFFLMDPFLTSLGDAGLWPCLPSDLHPLCHTAPSALPIRPDPPLLLPESPAPMLLPPLQPSDGALLRCLLLAALGTSPAEFISFSMHRFWSLQNSGSTYQLSCWEFLGRSLPLSEPQTPCLGNRCNTGSAIVSQMSKPTCRAPGTWLAPSGLKGLLWWLGRGGVVSIHGRGRWDTPCCVPSHGPDLETRNLGPPRSPPLPRVLACCVSASLSVYRGECCRPGHPHRAFQFTENYYIQST